MKLADHAYRWYPAATATSGLALIAAAIWTWRAAGRNTGLGRLTTP